MKDNMFTLKGDNGTGIDWGGLASEVGFKLELTGNKLNSAQNKECFS